jgi:hypothetical protein
MRLLNLPLITTHCAPLLSAQKHSPDQFSIRSKNQNVGTDPRILSLDSSKVVANRPKNPGNLTYCTGALGGHLLSSLRGAETHNHISSSSVIKFRLR